MKFRFCSFSKFIGTVVVIRTQGNSILQSSFSDIIGRAVVLDEIDSKLESLSFNSRQIMSGECNLVKWCSFLKVNTLANRGALYVSPGTLTFEADHCFFAHCYSTSGCSGLFSFAKTGTILFCCFENCSSSYVPSSGDGGNSVCVYNSNMTNIKSCCLVNCGHLYSYTHGAMNIYNSGVGLSLCNFTKCRGRTQITYSCALVLASVIDVISKFNVFQANFYGSCLTYSSPKQRVLEQFVFCNNTTYDLGIVYMGASNLRFEESNFLWNDKYLYYQSVSGSKIEFSFCSFDISSSSSFSLAASLKNHQFINCTFSTIRTMQNMDKILTQKCLLLYERDSSNSQRFAYSINHIPWMLFFQYSEL